MKYFVPLLLLPLGSLLAQTAATNAALRKYGTVAGVEAAPSIFVSKDSNPTMWLDGNPHTRHVVTGVPYTIVIDLPSSIPIAHIALAQSDYQAEQAPKDVEVQLDNGAVVKHTLELKRPEKKGVPAWQEVPVKGEAKTVKIKVLSNHAPSEKVNWGGLGDVAIFTSADLDARLKIPGYQPGSAPVFSNIPPIKPSATPKVRLPAVSPPGEHPRLMLGKSDLAELTAKLKGTDRGRETLATLTGIADAALAHPVDFPDPKGPQGQVISRGDEVARRHDKLAREAGTLGIAYAVTGEKKYADRAAQILTGYAKLYDQYEEHKGVNRGDTGKVMAQRLSESMWLIPLIEAYDYIYDSGALSDEDRKNIADNLIRPAIAFIWRKDPAEQAAERDKKEPGWRTADPGRGDGKIVPNWLNYYNAATIMAGAALGDQDMLDLAVANFRRQIAQGIGSDGMWGEGSISYQMFSLGALVPGLEVAARQGYDLWSFDDARLKMLFDSPLRYAYPDGTAPGINDSGRASLSDWTAMIYDYGYLRYQDPAYATLINPAPRQLHQSEGLYYPTLIYDRLPEVAKNAQGSTVFENLGYAVLRNDNIYALMDYGPHGGGHGHFDKLNLLVYGAGANGSGDELGGEPKFHKYEEALHSQWTRPTVAHNTMTVDGASQLECTGRLLVFEDTPDLKIMRAEAEAYPGGLLDRTVVVTPDAVIDLFHGRSGFSRTWDRTFRYQGRLEQIAEGRTPGEPLGNRDGYQHLKVFERLPAADGWVGRWQTKPGALDVTIAGAPGQEVILARGPDGEDIALARQKGETASFANVLALDGWKNPVKQAKLTPTGDPLLVAFEMTQADGTLTKVVVSHAVPAAEWNALGWHSDARVLCVREKDGQSTVLLGGGNFAEAGTMKFKAEKASNFLLRGRDGKLELAAN